MQTIFTSGSTFCASAHLTNFCSAFILSPISKYVQGFWYFAGLWSHEIQVNPGGGGGRGNYFPYILLNEIQTIFSQLAKQSARFLPADLCTDYAHYVKNHKSTVLRRNKSMAVKGGTVSHYYILVIHTFIDFVAFHT